MVRGRQLGLSWKNYDLKTASLRQNERKPAVWPILTRVMTMKEANSGFTRPRIRGVTIQAVDSGLLPSIGKKKGERVDFPLFRPRSSPGPRSQ